MRSGIASLSFRERERTREEGREGGQKVNCARTYQFIGKCARAGSADYFAIAKPPLTSFAIATVRIIDSSGEARWFSLPLSPLFDLSLSHFLASSLAAIHGIGKELSSLVTNFAKPRNRDSSRNAAVPSLYSPGVLAVSHRAPI